MWLPNDPVPVLKVSELKVDERHTLYIEESGNPKGNPVIIIHGGPGGRSKDKYRQYFNPDKWRIIQFDHRGCGRSKSIDDDFLKDNTTSDTVDDIDKVRKFCKIEKTGLFGISWGATLSLLYASKYQDNVKFVVNRSNFDNHSAAWSFINPIGKFFYPDRWEQLLEILTDTEKLDVFSSYYQRVFSQDLNISLEATYRWSVWERTLDKVSGKITFTKEDITEEDVHDMRILLHYYKNQMFLNGVNIFAEYAKIKETPVTIVHGRYDLYDPLLHTYNVVKSIPHAELVICPNAGHSTEDPGMLDEIVKAFTKHLN